MAAIINNPRFKAWDDSGDPLNGGTVDFYESGTNTRKDTYTDETKASVNTNPVTLDSQGEADIYLEGAYKIVVKDKDGVEQDTVDPLTDAGRLEQQWKFEQPAEQVDADTFEVAGNKNDLFMPDRRIRMEQDGTLYGSVVSRSLVSGNTQVTVRTDGGTSLTASLTRVSVSIVPKNAMPFPINEFDFSGFAQTVDSVATLSDSSFPANLERLWLSAYESGGTTGYGHLRRVGGGFTSSDDDGGINFVDSDGVKWQRVDAAVVIPEQFGHPADGTVDDAAMQRIVSFVNDSSDHYGMVLTPRKSYGYSTPIVINPEFRSIVSIYSNYTNDAPALLFDGDADEWAIDSSYDGTNPGTVEVDLGAFSVRFVTDDKTRNGINMSNHRQSLIKGVHVRDADTALLWGYAWTSKVKDCNFNFNNIGVDHTGGDQVNAIEYYSCRVDDNSDAGYVMKGRNIKIYGGVIQNNGTGIAFKNNCRNCYCDAWMEANDITFDHRSFDIQKFTFSGFISTGGSATNLFNGVDNANANIKLENAYIEGQPSGNVFETNGGVLWLDIIDVKTDGFSYTPSSSGWDDHLRYKNNTNGASTLDVAREPSLAGGWSNSDSGDPLRFWKDWDGNTRILGVVQDGSTGFDLFVLPESFCPKFGQMFFNIVMDDGSGNIDAHTLEVRSNGEVVITDNPDSTVQKAYIDISFDSDS